jgi:hypothetical protein
MGGELLEVLSRDREARSDWMIRGLEGPSENA